MDGLSRTWGGPALSERKFRSPPGAAQGGREGGGTWAGRDAELGSQASFLAPGSTHRAAYLHRKATSGPGHLSSAVGHEQWHSANGSVQSRGEPSSEARSASASQSNGSKEEDTRASLHIGSRRYENKYHSENLRVFSDVASGRGQKNWLSSSSKQSGQQERGTSRTAQAARPTGATKVDASFRQPLNPASPRAAYRASLQGGSDRGGASVGPVPLVWATRAQASVHGGRSSTAGRWFRATVVQSSLLPGRVWYWTRSSLLSAYRFLWVWLTVPGGLYAQVGSGIAGGSWGLGTWDDRWSAEAEAETQREWLLLYGPSARMDLIGHIAGHIHAAVLYWLLSYRPGQAWRSMAHGLVQLAFAGVNLYVYKLERAAYDSTMSVQADYENRHPVQVSDSTTDPSGWQPSSTGSTRSGESREAARARADSDALRKYCRLGLAMSPVREYVQQGYRSLALVCLAVSFSWLACGISLGCTLNPQAWGSGYGMCVTAADPIIPWYLVLLSFYAQNCIATDYASKQVYVVGGILAAALPAQATLAYLFFLGPYKGHSSVDNILQLLFLSLMGMLHTLHKGAARNIQMRMLVKRFEYIEGSTALRAMQHRAEVEKLQAQGQKYAAKALPSVLDRYTAPIRDKLHVLVGAADAVLGRLEARKERMRRGPHSATGSATSSTVRGSPFAPPPLVTSSISPGPVQRRSSPLAYHTREGSGTTTHAILPPTPGGASVDDELDTAEADLRAVLQDSSSILDTLTHEQVRAQASAYLVHQMGQDKSSLAASAGDAGGSLVHDVSSGPFTLPGSAASYSQYPGGGGSEAMGVQARGPWFTPPAPHEGATIDGTMHNEGVALNQSRDEALHHVRGLSDSSNGFVVSAALDAVDHGGGDMYDNGSQPDMEARDQTPLHNTHAVQHRPSSHPRAADDMESQGEDKSPVHVRPPSFQAHLLNTGTKLQAKSARPLTVDPVAANRAAGSALLSVAPLPAQAEVAKDVSKDTQRTEHIHTTRSAPEIVGGMDAKLATGIGGGMDHSGLSASHGPGQSLHIRTPERRSMRLQAMRQAYAHRTVFPVATAADHPAPPLPHLRQSSRPIEPAMPVPLPPPLPPEPVLAGIGSYPGQVSAVQALENSGVKAVIQGVAAESTDMAVQSTGLGDAEAASLLRLDKLPATASLPVPPILCPAKPAKAARHRRQGSTGTSSLGGSVNGTPVPPASVVEHSTPVAASLRSPPPLLQGSAAVLRAGRTQPDTEQQGQDGHEEHTPRPAIQKSSSPDNHHGAGGFATRTSSGGSGGRSSSGSSPKGDTVGGASGRSKADSGAAIDTGGALVAAPFENTDRLPESLFAESERYRRHVGHGEGVPMGTWSVDSDVDPQPRHKSRASARTPALMPVFPAGLLPPGVAASLAQHRAVSPAASSVPLPLPAADAAQGGQAPSTSRSGSEHSAGTRTPVSGADKGESASPGSSPAGQPFSSSPDDPGAGARSAARPGVSSQGSSSGGEHVATGGTGSAWQRGMASRQGMVRRGTVGSASASGDSSSRATPEARSAGGATMACSGSEMGSGHASGGSTSQNSGVQEHLRQEAVRAVAAQTLEARHEEPADMLQPLLGFEVAHGILPHVHVCDQRLLSQLGVMQPWQFGASPEMIEGVQAAYVKAKEEYARAVAANDSSVLVRLGREPEEVFGSHALVRQQRRAASQHADLSEGDRRQAHRDGTGVNTPQNGGSFTGTSVTASTEEEPRPATLVQGSAAVREGTVHRNPPPSNSLSSGPSPARPFANAVALHLLQRSEGGPLPQPQSLTTSSSTGTAATGNGSHATGQGTAETDSADVRARKDRTAPPGGSPASLQAASFAGTVPGGTLQGVGSLASRSHRVHTASAPPAAKAAQPSPGRPVAAKSSPAVADAASTGSTFVFGGSVSVRSPGAHARHGPAATAGPADTGGQVARFGLHVLVVDDEKVNQRIAGRYLQRLGCTWECLEDGRDVPDALLLSEKPYDVILLDILMKHSNGLEVCRALRNELNVDIPVIAATANYSATEAGLYRAAGFTRVLQKPYNQRDLAAALTQALGIQLGRQAARLNGSGAQAAGSGVVRGAPLAYDEHTDRLYVRNTTSQVTKSL